MIVKGKARQNGKQLGKYLTEDARKVNERVQVLETRGTSSQDVKKALLEMSLAAELTKGKDGLYHATINPDKSKDQAMSQDEFFRAVDILEEELKFTGQNRVIVLHEKHGRNHIHVVWQREKDGKLLSTSQNYAAHDRARGRIEQELKHERTHQPQNVKADLSEAWKKSKTGTEFVKAAQAQGYTIGRDFVTGKGSKRPFCVVDKDGKAADLVRQLPGVKTAEVKAKLKDVEAVLPEAKNLTGKTQVKDRQNEQARREQTPAREAAFEQEKEKQATRERMEKTAREAGQNFTDATKPNPQPQPEPERELTKKEKFAQTLADLRARQSQTKERMQEAEENKGPIVETPTQRRVREARENLQRDDFGLEHEI